MSSSFTSPDNPYDVFLSFRGVDTRESIVSHLYKELQARGINTFKDNERTELGDYFPPILHGAIENSKFAVVVLSKNYATSKWCLDELHLIMELNLKKKIYVIPVFYKVCPSDVKNLRGSFALTDHEDKFQEALKRIGNLKGTESIKYKDEAMMVEDIAGRISKHLDSMFRIPDENLVGMEDHLEQINPLLDMDVNTKKDKVRMIGIWGMGGIGKTTIAMHLYEQLKENFPTHRCVLNNVSMKKDDLLSLQRELASEILCQSNIKFKTVKDGRKFLSSRLTGLKVLIVLDNVDKKDQLSALAEVGWFGPGSRIIITTRDKSCLSSSCGVKYVYKVKYLNHDKALQLFQLTAFQGNPPPGDYQDLSNRFCKLAHGLPLALDNFGSYLLDKSLEEWQDALKMFEEAPSESIITVLKSSYDKLDNIGKNAFLHVACLFNGAPVEQVKPLLEGGNAGIKALEEKSLIDKTPDDHIAMHPLLEQTGRQIVCQLSENSPAHQKILWHHYDIYRVLEDNTGTHITEAIAFDISAISNDLHIKRDGFLKMYNLRFLKIYRHSRGLESDRGILMVDASLTLPHKIRFLHWDNYPLTTLSGIVTGIDCIVELILCNSKLRTLWSGTPKLKHLRKLDLSGSKHLKDLPDLKEAVSLEELILEGCTSLRQIPESILGLPKLQKIDVSYCDRLGIKVTESISNDSQDTSLSVTSVYLKLPASALEGICLEYPTIKGNLRIDLKVLKGNAEHLSFIPEKQISRKMMMLDPKPESPPYGFSSLDIRRLKLNSNKKNRFKCNKFAKFPWLTELNLINLNIEEIPDDINHMRVLEKLDLSGNGFKRLPETMKLLTKLKHLTLCSCHALEELPELYQLERLKLSDCTKLRRLVKLDHGRYSSLLEVWLDNCKNIESLSEELSHFTKLTYLDLSRQDFETVPTSIMELTSLVTLSLSYNSNLVSLTGVPTSIKCLKAHACKSLTTSDLPFDHIDFTCPRLKQNSSQIIQFSDGRLSREVPICACLEEGTPIGTLECLQAHGCKSLIPSDLSKKHDLSPCPYWKQNSPQIIRFPAGRLNREVPICACFEKKTRNYQVTISTLWQRLNSWLWFFPWCVLIAGVAILLVGITVLLSSGSDPFSPVLVLSVQIYLNALLMIYCFYIIITKSDF